MQEVKVLLYDIKSSKKFIKEFESEYKRDCFIEKLKYSKKIILLNDYKNTWNN